MSLLDHVPLKYHSYIKSTPKITTSVDIGIVAYHGESNVEHVTYEFGTDKMTHTIILPALINQHINGKLKQTSVIIHWK